jgi:hypothetical protein
MALLSSRMDNNMEQSFDSDRQKLDKPPENIENLVGTKSNNETDLVFDQYVHKCLSMIIHHDDIKKMAEIIMKIHRSKSNNHT